MTTEQQHLKSQTTQRSNEAKYTHVEPSSHAADVTGCVCQLENSKLEGCLVDRRVWMAKVWITDIPLYNGAICPT